MDRLTKRYNDNSGYGTIENTDGHGNEIDVDLGPYCDCVDKLGQLEDLMEKYNIDNLTDLEIALNYFDHRYDDVQTKRVYDKETPIKIVKWEHAKPVTRCAKCGAGLERYHDYCWGCGQKIDWSKYE